MHTVLLEDCMLFSQVTAALGGRRMDSSFDVCRSMPRLSKIIVAKRVDKNGERKPRGMDEITRAGTL